VPQGSYRWHTLLNHNSLYTLTFSVIHQMTRIFCINLVRSDAHRHNGKVGRILKVGCRQTDKFNPVNSRPDFRPAWTRWMCSTLAKDSGKINTSEKNELLADCTKFVIRRTLLLLLLMAFAPSRHRVSTSCQCDWFPRLCRESRQRKWLRGDEYFHPSLQRTRTIKTVFNSVWRYTTFRTAGVDWSIP